MLRRSASSRDTTAGASGAPSSSVSACAGSNASPDRRKSRGRSCSHSRSPAQFHTLERLTDLIVPVENGRPGALQAGVPAWIDALLAVNDELKTKYVAGLGWLDTTMLSRAGSSFAGAPAAQQTTLLDLIAFKKNTSTELDPGIEFFTLARRMTVDGFYTSDAGIHEIIPNGRPPLTEFVVPQASIDYVISRSPFK